MGNVVRARRGRPGLTENALVDLAEAAAIRTGVDLAVLATGRRRVELKDPVYETSFVQQLVEYLLMYPGLDDFEIGWEEPFGRKRVDIVLRSRQKTVLVECKDFRPWWINKDARKLRQLMGGADGDIRNPAGYVLALWRTSVPENVTAKVKRHYANARGLDPSLTKLVAHKRASIFAPERAHRWFAAGLFKVQ